MADVLTAVDALDRIATPRGTASPVTLQPVAGRGLAMVIARKGRAAELAARVDALYGLDLPEGPALAAGDGIAFMGTAPGAWLAVAEAGRPAWALDLAAALQGLASVADQSDAYAGVRVSGPAAEPMLTQSVGLDLHPGAFPVGAAAVTTAAHLGLVLWRSGAEAFEVLAFRSYAKSFWHWLTENAQAFGVEAEPRG